MLSKCFLSCFCREDVNELNDLPFTRNLSSDRITFMDEGSGIVGTGEIIPVDLIIAVFE